MRTYVRRYGWLSFAKNIGKNLSNKYGQKLLDRAKKFRINAIKTALKRAIQKTAEATIDLIGNKITDKISKNSSAHSKKFENDNANDELEVPKKKHIPPEKDNKLLMN